MLSHPGGFPLAKPVVFPQADTAVINSFVANTT